MNIFVADWLEVLLGTMTSKLYFLLKPLILYKIETHGTSPALR